MDLLSLEYIALGALAVLIVVFAVMIVRRRRPTSGAAPAVPAKPKAAAFLERTSADGEPHIFALHKPLVAVGRGEDNDIFISPDVPGARSVSRRHAQIRREDLDFIVEDLGSQNGIMVNGLVTRRNLLRHGYRVSFGGVEFIFRTTDADDAAESAR